MSALLFARIGELTTNDPSLGDHSPMGRLRDAALVVTDGVVSWIGPNDKAPAADELVDVDGAAVVPGFVDAHTHLVFAGERSAEFEARMAGKRYDAGGISRTVTATRAAGRESLTDDATRRWTAMRNAGTTTLEVKSGYELTVDGEVRLLELASAFSDETTFLGAHVVPAEWERDRDGYVSLVAGAMLDACAPRARWIDVFCERGAFSVDEARHVLEAGRRHGLGLRVHANQLSESGGVALAVEMGAASVDHCTYLSDSDISALGGSSTVATLLPGAEFSTRSLYPSARRLLDAGATVALATDCNPGTSYVTSMPFVIALGVREMDMTCDEALWAATAGGAAALGRTDIGRLGLGARGDLAVLDAPRAAHLAYRPGSALVTRAWGPSIEGRPSPLT